ncbi:hypothetical protein ACQP00_12620 [Dactylosporangium sp. CS-047395]|uniref:hypothetical protein n=1 Tax=Dactylosporangium sp. CS-047395 TaxID=3239936 RepID=UPI003D924A7C
MIVAVTGPSAAGKTTWCREHHPTDTVPEYVPTGEALPGPDPAEQAAFWCAVNARRWSQALHRERASGLAVCDDDPLKLHYSWSLARIGELSRQHWQAEVDVHRRAVAESRLGFADLIIVCAPPEDELRRRRNADPTRRRRNFDLHVRLAGPLRQWYEAVERVGAARVVWGLPPSGLPVEPPPPGADRYDLGAFDAVMAELPRFR